jgi:hypothetical protein
MPFRSEKQRRYLWKNHPKIAKDWTDTYGSKPQPKKKAKGGIMEPYRGSYISGKVDGKMLSNPSLRKYYKGLI